MSYNKRLLNLLLKPKRNFATISAIKVLDVQNDTDVLASILKDNYKIEMKMIIITLMMKKTIIFLPIYLIM